MSDFLESEKRQFVRVPVNVNVDYRFIRQAGAGPVPEQVFTGHTVNIGAGGLLLVGEIPDANMISDMLMRRVILAIDIHLPHHEPIQALARVAWLEAVDQARRSCSMGVTFKEITTTAQDELFRFVITSVAG